MTFEKHIQRITFLGDLLQIAVMQVMPWSDVVRVTLERIQTCPFDNSICRKPWCKFVIASGHRIDSPGYRFARIDSCSMDSPDRCATARKHAVPGESILRRIETGEPTRAKRFPGESIPSRIHSLANRYSSESKRANRYPGESILPIWTIEDYPRLSQKMTDPTI